MIITSISGQDYEKRQKILKIKNNSEIKRAVNSSLFLEYKCLNQERNSKDFQITPPLLSVKINMNIRI